MLSALPSAHSTASHCRFVLSTGSSTAQPLACARRASHDPGTELAGTCSPPHSRYSRTQAAPGDSVPSARLSSAARRYAEGIEAGLDPDDLVAQELGVSRAKDLSNHLSQYKDKVKAKLQATAQQVKEEEEFSHELFELGKKAYGRGQYDASSQLLVAALDATTGPFSRLAGDIQLWLGLAYQACGRDQECIQLYKNVEKHHPIKRIRKEAANLRFILEAPKLTRGPDERVTLPVMGSAVRQVTGHNKRNVRQSGGGGGLTKDRRPKTLEEQFWETYKPPDILPKNKYVIVASIVLAISLAVWSAASS
ncbi:hypothetical protein WJX73_010665 [Symbiochloris irregularis]|uniref:Uncharacterized protein n=1 Tax=Symbiochloris irregularis TaxID=706552 RepID=A0AAW1PFE7_9CHLO